MSGDLVERLNNFANGCRASMWQSRDETIRLMDEAAARITELKAQNARLVEKLRQARDDLLTVGNDYPGSSCQMWCAEAARRAWDGDRDER